MAISEVCGLNFPNEVDPTPYDSINRAVAGFANPNADTSAERQNTWFAFASAWNGLAYRLISAGEYHDLFIDSIKKSTSPPADERFRQEKYLFGFSMSALSAIECGFMAAYAAGSALFPEQFLLLEDRDLNKYPKPIANTYLGWRNDDPLSSTLFCIANSVEIKALEDFRNALSHRGVLPRKSFLGNAFDQPAAIPANPKVLASKFDYSDDLGPHITSRHYIWTCSALNSFLIAFDGFCARHEQNPRNSS